MRCSELARDCRLSCRMSDPKLWGKSTSSNYTSWSEEMTLGLLVPFHSPDILIVIICEYSYLNKPILHCNSLTHTIKIVEMLTMLTNVEMAKHHWNLNLCCLIDFVREGCTSWEWLIRKLRAEVLSWVFYHCQLDASLQELKHLRHFLAAFDIISILINRYMFHTWALKPVTLQCCF